MRRFFLNFLASLSLLLLVATIILWVRSHRLTDHLSWRNAHGSRAIYTARNYLVVDLFFIDWSNYAAEFQPLRYYPDLSLPLMNYIPLLNFDRGDVDITFQHAGFYWWERRNAITQRRLIIAGVPFWLIALITSLLPLTWTGLKLRSHHRHRKLKLLNLCTNCSYDLRATAPGSPCPECGTVMQ